MSELLTYAKNVVFTTKLFLLKEKLQINNCSKSFLFFYLGLYCLWTIEHVYATDTFFHTIWHLWEFHDRINKGVKSHRFACFALLKRNDNFSNTKSVQIIEVTYSLLRLFQWEYVKCFLHSFLYFQSQISKDIKIFKLDAPKRNMSIYIFFMFL